MLKSNKRAYNRDTYLHFDTKVSLNGEVWYRAVVFDLSAGGLKFHSDMDFKVGDVLWFDLEIPEFLSKREMKAKGTICREEHENGELAYGVEFKDLSNELIINIDENILFRERLHKDWME